MRNAIEKGKIPKKEGIISGFSSAVHSLICLSKEFLPLSQALIWADGGSSGQLNNYRREASLLTSLFDKV